MKLKVIYTGNPAETQIVNAETGEEVEGVDSVEISIDAFGGYCALLLQGCEVDLNNLEQASGRTPE